MKRIMLEAGTAGALLYFLTLIGASLTWPGYSHVTQYASELGSAAAPHPQIFNIGIITTGTLGVAGGLGVMLYFAGMGRWLSGGLAGLALAAWGTGMIFGGLYPMPNPLHNGFGLVMGVMAAPLFLMVALRGRAGTMFHLLLIAWFAAMAALIAIMFGAGSLVTTQNVGLWQRGLALAMIPGIGFTCAALAGRLKARG